MKYRIKLEDKRVVGPFAIKDLVKLYKNEKISEMTLIQQFPEGNWIRIVDDRSLFNEIVSLEDKTKNDETFILKLNELKKENVEVEPEIDVAKNEEKEEPKIEEKIDEPEKEVVVETKLEEFQFDIEDVDETPLETETADTAETDNKDEIEKTKINPDYQEYLKELKEAQERAEAEKKKKEEIELQLQEETPDYENDATQVVGIGEIRGDLINAMENEQDFQRDLEEKERLKEEIRIKKKKKAEKDNIEDDDEDDDELKPKRSIFVMVAIALLVVFFIFDEEDGGQKGEELKFLEPVIAFPDSYDISDKNKAEDFYKKGLLAARDETLKAKINASKLFYRSAENSYSENPALGRLIFYYSDLLLDSNTKIDDSNTIFKLVQIFSNKAFLDPNFAGAITYFYHSIGKPQAAKKIFDKYITLNKKKASEILFSARLLALIETGDIDLALNTAKKLMTIKNKKMITLKALIKFYLLEEKVDEVKKLITEGKKLYPNSVYFYLEEGFIAIDEENTSGLKDVIKKIVELKFENSKYFYSKFLSLRGFYYVFNNNIAKATEDFRKSLDINKSELLIEKLALLEFADNEKVNDLIKVSRAEKYVKQAENALEDGDLKLAFKYALRGSTEAPNQMKPKLLLAKLQTRRGYIQDAITTLENLYDDISIETKYKDDILYELIAAYTSAYKFKKVQEYIKIARGSSFTNEFKLYKAQANYYIAKGELPLGLNMLIRAISSNPLDDSNFYELAKLYIRLHKYQKASNTLKRAMDLDPSRVDYKIDYAKVLYELDNSDAAIGYLYNILEEFPDNPKIMSEIGIYFYRSGQIKKYNQIKNKLLELPKKDVSLFKFLIESARLDDNLEKVVEFSEKLLELDPGDLKIRMELSTIYINRQEYGKAKVHLDAIKERLSTYPRLQYLYAKLHLLIDEVDEAKKMALNEIKENPLVVDGYLILGEIHIREKDMIAARKQYVKALQRDSKNVDAILGIAFVALQTNQYDLAIDQYKKALEMDTGNAQVYKLLGDAYRKIGQSQLAIPVYKQFLELSPNSKYKNKIETYINTMQ